MNKSLPHIRPATYADITRIAEIHVFARRLAYFGIAPDDYLFHENGVCERMTFFAENLQDNFVYDDGIIKGFVTINPSPDEDAAEYFELQRLYVEPLFQGQGIGAALLQFFEQIAAARAFSKTCLWVLEKNTKARGFYEKLGYFPDGASRHAANYEAMHIRCVKRKAGL